MQLLVSLTKQICIVVETLNMGDILILTSAIPNPLDCRINRLHWSSGKCSIAAADLTEHLVSATLECPGKPQLTREGSCNLEREKIRDLWKYLINYVMVTMQW